MTLPLTLPALAGSLRPEQTAAVSASVEHLLSARRGHEGSMLLVSPTGTGKSYIQGAIHRTIRETHGRLMYTTFPQSEIAEAVYLKTHGDSADPILFMEMSPAKRQDWLEAHGLWTIKRLHNELSAGRIAMPDFLQHDEAHHSTDDTHEIVHGICGLCPRIGATATDYRGTPAETAKLRERWPRQFRVLTLRDAVKLGRLSMPTFDVWPLVDDEQIDVVAGEFQVTKVESEIKERLGDLVERIRPYFTPRERLLRGMYDRPTMIAVPGVNAVAAVVDAMRKAGLPAVGVTGDTTDFDRRVAFEGAVSRYFVLVQIRVVGEGVDLPMRRLIDLSPTMSPVLWMQRVGRITRPVPEGEEAPEYIACCHNLARHAYLWHGLMPASSMRKATEAWGEDFKPSRRFLARAIDVEGLGRFIPSAIPFLDGTTGTMYAMQSKDGSSQYAVVLHPIRPDPYFFARTIPFTGEMLKGERVGKGGEKIEFEYRERDYNAPEAKWRKIDALPELRGMQSIKITPLTPGQAGWWKKSAKWFGLNPDAKITNREFQVLPIAANSGVKLEA